MNACEAPYKRCYNCMGSHAALGSDLYANAVTQPILVQA